MKLILEEALEHYVQTNKQINLESQAARQSLAEYLNNILYTYTILDENIQED